MYPHSAKDGFFSGYNSSQCRALSELPSYFYVVLLSRIVTKLGKHRMVNARIIEGLHPVDFAFLVDFFNEINHKVISMLPIECSHCGNRYVGEVSLVGEL